MERMVELSAEVLRGGRAEALMFCKSNVRMSSEFGVGRREDANIFSEEGKTIQRPQLP